MKRLFILLLLVLLTMIVIACSSLNENESTIVEKKDDVTITFMHLWSEELYTAKYRVINKIVEDYMLENPHTTIKVEILDNEQYKDKIKIISTTNALPDVGVTWPSGYLKPYVEGRLLAPLDSVISDELSEKFIKGTTDAFKINGKTYGLPLEFNITPVFYNKEIFEQYHLETPRTYEELLSIIDILNANDVIPIALGNKERWTGSMWYLYLAERFAGPQALTNVLAGKESFSNHEDLLLAAKEIQHLVERNAFSINFNGQLNDEAKTKFYNEQAAMYMMGTWELGNFTSNPEVAQSFKDKVGFFKFPYEPYAQGNMNSWVGGPGVGLFVAQNSRVREEAKQFATYFVKAWGEQSVEQAGVIPATKVNTVGLKLPGLYNDILGELNRANSMILYADVLLEPEDAEQHLNQIQALFGLMTTPEQFNEAHDEFLYVPPLE